MKTKLGFCALAMIGRMFACELRHPVIEQRQHSVEVGALSSGQVRMTVTGDPDEVRGMLSRLAPRLSRNG